jgi:D-alanyl-D-alanine carboxypeptidase
MSGLQHIVAGGGRQRVRGMRLAGLATIVTAGGLSILASQPAEAQGRRHAALILDANTGRVLSEHAADEPRYPASLTKMMTLYVLFELIEQKKLNYDTRIVFSPASTRVQPSKLGLAAGDSLTVLEAAKALITKSANDVAMAVAEHVAGSDQKFAAVMTQTARRIGMKSTTFKNPHGLPNDEQVTTARDMVTLGLRLQDDFPKHYQLFAAREFSHNGSTHRNHNTLLLTYEGTDGIKTGYIGSSGFNLVANVKRGDKHVLGVVFGGATAGARNQTMKTLLNIALIKASPVKTRQSTPVARGRPVPTPAVAARPEATPAVATAAATITPPPVAPPRASSVPAVAPAIAQAQAQATALPQPKQIALAPPALETPSPAPAAPTPEVQMARVRPLLVAPRPPAQAALPPGPIQATTQTRPTQVAQDAAMPPPPLASGLAAAPPKRIQAVAPAPIQAPAQAPAQVATLMPPPGASRLNGPAVSPAPSAVAANAVHLQVGAYASKAEAEKQLSAVRQQGGATVATLAGEAVAAVSNGKPVFRARFTGIDPAKAGGICNDLRRRQIDCMVARPE